MLAVGAAFWPGLAMYDTVGQYEQTMSDEVADWHPPIMVRLWQALHPLGAGTAPMFALQVALYAFGFALIVAALWRSGRGRAAVAAALVGLSPLLIGWQMVVLKDAQMLGALLAAFGLIAHFRLAARRVPVAAVVPVALLVIYATLVRANALFATVPLVAMLVAGPRSLTLKAGVALTTIALILVVSPLINHRLLRAEPSGVAKSQPLFDLAAIAVANPADPAPFTPAERDQIAVRHCAKAFFWDPLGDEQACGTVIGRVHEQPEGALYRELAAAALRHPLSYAAHRLAHWNSTERWLVPAGLIGASPPDRSEPNDLGLVGPANAAATAVRSAAVVEAGTPLGWPILWTAIAALVIAAAWRRRGEAAGGLALALAVSALTLEASFLAISIASDLRYHLWPMAASALALVLVSDGVRPPRAATIAASVLLAAIILGGLATRSTLPRAPDNYRATIDSSTL